MLANASEKGLRSDQRKFRLLFATAYGPVAVRQSFGKLSRAGSRASNIPQYSHYRQTNPPAQLCENLIGRPCNTQGQAKLNVCFAGQREYT